MSFFNRLLGGRDTIYNHFAYNDKFTICLGSRDSEIREDVLTFHPNTERINEDVLVDGKKVDLSDTKIRIINAQIFGGSVEEILFPSTLLEVKGSFADSNLRNVDFEKTRIDFIGRRFFKGCTNLETVSFPECLWRMGSEAFAGCRKLKRLDLSRTHLEEIPGSAFSGCKELAEVLLSDATRRIGAFAFQDTSLREIDLKNAKEIDLSAFLGTNIECIHLPEGVSSVSYHGLTGRDMKIPSFLVSSEEDEKKLKGYAESVLAEKLRNKPGQKINVSYPGDEDDVLRTLEFLEESGFVNLTD